MACEISESGMLHCSDINNKVPNQFLLSRA
jgi:hypothetical protein